MLAAAVWIDRAVEADIRRVVAGDDGPRRIHRQCRGQRRRLFVGRPPAVVERDAAFGFEASATVARRAASLARPDCDRHIHAAVYVADVRTDRKSTRLNSSHSQISYAVFCLKKKTYERCGGPGLSIDPDKFPRRT